MTLNVTYEVVGSFVGSLWMTSRRKRPPQVGTVGGLIAGGLKMWISCNAIGCRNNADVDLPALRDQLGADYRIADFVARSR